MTQSATCHDDCAALQTNGLLSLNWGVVREKKLYHAFNCFTPDCFYSYLWYDY